MAVADDPLLARLGLEIGMLCEKLCNLCFDGQRRVNKLSVPLEMTLVDGPSTARRAR
jgi:hypothetical protein